MGKKVMLQEEYYVIKSENNNNYPLFAWAQSSRQYNMGKPVEYSEPLKLRLGEPISRKFEWVDYHSLSGSVISKRILDALLPLDLYGVQFVPAKVTNPKDPFAEPRDYWYVHVWNEIACLDMEESDLDLYEDGDVASIIRMVLNEEKLAMVEPRKRMMFGLVEDCTVYLVHEVVKEAIESVNPKGVRFFKATEWGSDRIFEK